MDGNKRTAFQTAYQFLKDNGHQLERAQGHEHAAMMEKLGQGQIGREDAAKHFQSYVRERQPEKVRESSIEDRLRRADADSTAR